MVFIYVLKLINDKYYIGKTNDPNFRLIKHFDSNGSKWTQLYKPIDIVELIKDCDDYDEDKYTIKYMEKYGVDNVRGGSFCELKLSNENIATIKKMIKNSTNKCFNCGSNDHFINDCNKKNYNKTNRTICYRCNRNGHYANECYAKTDVYGDNINDSNNSDSDDNEEYYTVYTCDYCNKEFETKKGATYHENFYCKYNKNK